MATLISIAVTALGVLVSLLSGEQGRTYARLLSFVLLCSMLILLAALYLGAYLRDLRSVNQEAKALGDFARHVPATLVFRKWLYDLKVTAHGESSIIWTWELASDSSRGLSEIAFPVLFTGLHGPQPSVPSARVDSVHVNGLAISTRDRLVMSERRELLTPQAKFVWGEADYVLYGQVRVPVDFKPGSATCRVILVLKFGSVFGGPTDRVEVDVPYVVEDLVVTVSDESRVVRKDVSGGGPPILAKSLMDLFDSVDSDEQSRLWRQDGNRLVWTTKSAKVGYSYILRVRYEDRPQSEQGPPDHASLRKEPGSSDDRPSSVS